MLTMDPLNRLSASGAEAHQAARVAVVTAAHAQADPGTRESMGRHQYAQAAEALADLQDTAVMIARDMAEAHRRDLFDLTRRAAHVVADPLILETRRNAARRTASKVSSQTAALAVVQEASRRPDRNDGEVAGAVAERAYDQGWDDVVAAWADGALGHARGGRALLDRLRQAERVANGAETLPGLEDLEPLEAMAERFGLPLTKPALTEPAE